MDQPFLAFHIHMHLKVDALEDDFADKAREHTGRRRYNNDVLRADNDLHGLVDLEAAVYTGEIMPAETHKEVLEHDAFHDIGVADKVGDKGVLRLVVDILRAADLLDAALVHDHDGVRHGQGFLLVVGDIDEGDVHFALQALEFELHLLAQFQVQRAERFVQQQDPRRIDQAARNGHALLLAARKLVNAAALKPLEADRFEHFEHFGPQLFLRHLFQPQAKRDVLKHIEVREQRVLLEHRVHLPLIRRQRGDVLAVKKDTAGLWCDKPGNHAQSGRFAAARRAQKSDELLVMNVERKAVQDPFPIKVNDNVLKRYDQRFIHFTMHPPLRKSAAAARLRAGCSRSAPIMLPRKRFVTPSSFGAAAAAHTTLVLCSIDAKHKFNYTGLRPPVNHFFTKLSKTGAKKR